jgi:methylenetetrahydrofolate dehydrogenase (NADP+)/methenyltetrahydrofolate cyclohydrolase
MVARILDGKAVAQKLRERVATEAQAFAERHGRPPGLDVVLVGEDPASVVYTRNKEQAAAKAGLRGRLHKLPADTPESRVLELVRALDADGGTDGVLVQLPLPAGIDAERVIEAIDPDKDVDGLHPVSIGRLASGRDGLVPCTPRGIMVLLGETGIELRGARAVVVGRSNLVGRPIAQLLLREHATVTMAHSRTRDLPALCREADVLVVAVGRARMVGGEWVKPGAVVIDVGTNRGEDGKLVGDVDTAAAAERAGWITPVPGGVGPMTIASLLANTLVAARRRLGD